MGFQDSIFLGTVQLFDFKQIKDGLKINFPSTATRTQNIDVHEN
jgi:hypothetical protein